MRLYCQMHYIHSSTAQKIPNIFYENKQRWKFVIHETKLGQISQMPPLIFSTFNVFAVHLLQVQICCCKANRTADIPHSQTLFVVCKNRIEQRFK
jgi:hypothetical protein